MSLARIRARFALTLPRVTMFLLIAAALATGIVVYQAYGAQRSHEATVARALTEYGAFARWELSGRFPDAIIGQLGGTFRPVVGPTGPRGSGLPGLGPLSLQEFAAALRRRDTPCGCTDRLIATFRYAPARGVFEAEGDLPEALGRWVRDTLRQHRAVLVLGRARNIAPARGRLAVPEAVDMVIGILLTPPPGPELALVFHASRDAQGVPIEVYGFLTDPARLLSPMLARLLREGTFLPPSLTRSAPNETLLTVRVSTPRGQEVFSVGPRASAGEHGGGVDTTASTLGNLLVSAALTPEAAKRLIVGGPPRARLPLLIGFLLLAAGLVAVALAQLRRQQQFMRARAAFVAGVSHELRTPLAQIRLLAEMLHTDRLESPASRRRSLRIIDQEARRLSFLVDNVLTFTRAERDMLRLAPVPLELRREVSDAVGLFAPLAQKAQVEFEVAVPTRLQVLMDPGAFRQVLVNLLDNAVRYGPPGQTVLITARAAERDCAVVELSITDEGPGVPAEDAERILEPYVRLDREQERAAGGTGLGLAIVRDIMSRHGGSVRVEPTAPADHGACIVLALPYVKASAPADSRVPVIEETVDV